MNKASVVMTTIRSADLLEGYRQNFEDHGHLEQVKVIVIPDCNTPRGVFEKCADLKARGLDVACPELDVQGEFLKRAGDFRVAVNTDYRRNVGYLMALENGSDFVISIDDDNYCVPGEDYFAAHETVCMGRSDCNVTHSSNGWYNPMAGTMLYPRGFPYRSRESCTLKSAWEQVRIVANEGLWTGDPDVDAISWLNLSKDSKMAGVKSYAVLGYDTWCPINSQNTSVVRDAIPAYWFVDMEHKERMGRFGDIFQGYFLQACAKELGDTVRIGPPIVQHIREGHNFLKDAALEMPCIILLEEFMPWLREVKLWGNNYSEVYTCLSHLLEEKVSEASGGFWANRRMEYFTFVSMEMRKWVEACAILN